MPDQLPWSRLPPADGSGLGHPRGPRAFGLVALAIGALLIASVVSLGWTGALFSAQAPAQTSNLTSAGKPAAETSQPACRPIANLQFDPYLQTTSQAQPSPGQAPPPFESLMTSASALLPAGSHLPAGTVGVTGSVNGATGSAQQPVAAERFAVGYCDETELSQYDPATVPTCPAPPTPYTSSEQYDRCVLDAQAKVAIPAGAVAESPPTGYTAQGVGLPFVAVYPLSEVTTGAGGDLVFAGPPVISAVPVTILYSSYRPLPSAFAADQPTSGEPASMRAVVTFDLTTDVSSGVLKAGATYVAYLMIQDTDQSGPLANHIWYFVP